MAYRNYATANGFIVDGVTGDFTSLDAALSAAQSGTTIFIRPGTYTAATSFTLKAGVNLTAYDCDSETPNVILQGALNNDALVASFAGTCSISGIAIRTNGTGKCLTVSGASATIVNLFNCDLRSTAGTATALVSYTSSSGTSKISFYDCTGDIGIASSAVFAATGAGTLFFDKSYFTNTGASTTANTNTSATLTCYRTTFNNGINHSSGGRLDLNWSEVKTSSTTALTITNAVNSAAIYSSILAGTGNPGISVGGGCTFDVHACVLSPNGTTNMISGAGFTNVGSVTQVGTSIGVINTTSIGGRPTTMGFYNALTQPALFAYVTTTTGGVTGDGTVLTVVFNNVSSGGGFDRWNSNNLVNDFNTGTGVFTAQVAGVYLVQTSLELGSLTASHTSGQVRIVKSGTVITRDISNPGGSRDANNLYEAKSMTLLNLAAGDTVRIDLTVSGGTKVVTVDGTAAGIILSWLSIAMLC